MKQGRHSIDKSGRRPSARRYTLMLLALALVVVCAIGGTIAYFTAQTPEVKNTFTAAGAPTPEIEETFDGTTKSNVKVRLGTDGSGSYFIRAAIVFTVQNEDGETIAYAPRAGVDYKIEYGLDWTEGADGYWYYPSPVAPGGETTDLIVSCTNKCPEHLVVDIIAQTIQAEPADAVVSEWGFDPSIS